MSPDDKIKGLPGIDIDKIHKRDNRKLAREMREDMEGLSDLMEAMAEYRMIEFRAYLTAGFTKEQSLELCCAAVGGLRK